jgi:hypothetical protein
LSHPSASLPTQGIVFPATEGDQNRRSTPTVKKVLAAALAPLDAAAAAQVQAEAQWRSNYPHHFRRWVQRALDKPTDAVRSAQHGLEAAMASMRWSSAGQEMPLNGLIDLLQRGSAASDSLAMETRTLRGTHGPAEAAHPLSIPYKGKLLTGAALAEQARAWAVRGIIEASAAQALIDCVDNPQWFDLSDRTLVLLGAGSEAGPLRILSRWRANIVAVDLPRPEVWERIGTIADAGNAVVHVPVSPAHPDRNWTARAGADLLTQLPDIAQWLRSFKGPLDIAAHCYADGERHLRLAAAMDALQALACHEHPQTTLAFLATPTDVYAIPQSSAATSMARYRDRPLLSKALQRGLAMVTGARFFKPNVESLVPTASNLKAAVVDSLVIQQGPNYALAKRLQQWRALVARAAGHQVSINVAPPTETSSVLSNRAIAAGYQAADVFGVEVFQPETTTALMAALWVHDLRRGAAETATDAATAAPHPLDLISQGACHGGFWTVAYCPRTALPFVAVLGLLRASWASLRRSVRPARSHHLKAQACVRGQA